MFLMRAFGRNPNQSSIDRVSFCFWPENQISMME
jgi:hypothetical protein